jgi:hypothetical protein
MAVIEALPLRSCIARAAVLDHALSLSGPPSTVLGEIARIMHQEARLLIRERNWRWEMDGESRTVITSFRRYGGDLYFGEVERTLRPPLEVERVWLLDPRDPEVSRLMRLPRDRLAVLRRADFPGVSGRFLCEEKFSLPQFVAPRLEEVVREAGLRPRAWLERDGAYLTLLAEKEDREGVGPRP